MKRRIGKTARNVLTAKRVEHLTEQGLYADGGGLYLQIGREGGKSWLFRYHNGRGRYMGLGPLADVGLADARKLAAQCRDELRQGFDPLELRRQRRSEARLAASRAIAFKECCETYIAAHEASWKNPKHRQQWENTLRDYAYPVMGNLQVRDIDLGHVLKVLEPVWNTKRETAKRLRARLERVLAWATTRGYREGDNPARWEGNLKHLLAADSKTQSVNHHSALPYTSMFEFMNALRQQPGVAALALQFTILTATRTSEVIHAKWDEVDWKHRTWTVPAKRMKAGKPHSVTLSEAAIAVLEQVKGLDGTYVFPGQKRPHKPAGGLSNMAMLTLLQRRMGRPDLTVHGFRSSFRDWAAETTAYPNHVVEMALSHTISDKVEAAYRRGDLLEKRARLTDAWAAYCQTAPAEGNVTPIQAAG